MKECLYQLSTHSQLDVMRKLEFCFKKFGYKLFVKEITRVTIQVFLTKLRLTIARQLGELPRRFHLADDLASHAVDQFLLGGR